ncbi:MAG: hypothetical protein A2749_00215 [Parcubacteria group bacterium RIFCSPHIGHO2_01_FULL_45_26]|nr:MAG: hypothetical protein A2749_00215 [Parcubacteria group bacterium RIFCSPHIGHO2_01_FULL_45_26]
MEMKEIPAIRKRNKVKLLLLELINSIRDATHNLVLKKAQRHTELSVDWQTGRYHFKSYANVSVARLHKSRMVKFENRSGRRFLYLTEKGLAVLAKYKLGSLALKKPWRWDGKWRLVMFDIKEPKKVKRDLLRRQLIILGFIRLQDSVWVYPYECREASILIKAGLQMAGEVLYVTANEIENDIKLRKHFGLT